MFRDNPAMPADKLSVVADLADHLITIRDAAGSKSFACPANLTAQGLGSEVFQEQRIHGALEADMKLVDGPFRKSEDLDLPGTQALEEACDVFLVSA